MASLPRFAELCRSLNIPDGGNRTFYHVAGTNGKGSTCAVIQAILTARGIKTGATYSPYVFNVRERIQVDGQLISRKDFERAEQAVQAADQQLQNEGLPPASPFELKTAMAFWHWEQVGCDAAVVEVGIGGRLDVTNIIRPHATTIVSIGFDHTELLGPTLAEIAAEKAGIIKPGVPALICEVPDQARAAIESRAREVGAPLFRYGHEWIVHADSRGSGFVLELQGKSWHLPRPARLKGPIQIHNAAAAVVTCLVADPDFAQSDQAQVILERALRVAYQPGRFQVVPTGDRVWVLDGAHNAQATDQLVRSFRAQFPGLQAELIHGMFQSREPESTLPSLAQICRDAHFVPIAWPGSWSPEDLAQRGRNHFEQVTAHASVAGAVDALRSNLVLVTGSYYLLAEVAEAASLPVQKDHKFSEP